MPEAEHPPLVVIVGPTAVGKTAVAIRLAAALNGHVISADSRQVYRRMDIGTAKPTARERQMAPHSLIDFLEPDAPFNLAAFQAAAYSEIDRAVKAGRLPLLVGGTGQYVHAVIRGWSIPHVPPDEGLRADLTGMADVYGAAALHVWLSAVDPEAALRIDYRNVRRVVRALEVFLTTGSGISALQGRQGPPYDIIQIGLTRPRASLYSRIDSRVDRMIADGLVDEVAGLLRSGLGWDLPSMSSLGYIQFEPYFRRAAPLEECIAALKHDTRRFVRQQYTWFRLDDPAITWFNLDETDPAAVLDLVQSWLLARQAM